MDTLNDKSREIRRHIYGHRTLGQKLADGLAEYAGSWAFIIIFLFIIILWISINTYLLLNKPFDPYPFILLNLGLSMVAAIQAPVILMSQNRSAERDRRKAEMDYHINKKAELEIQELGKKLDALNKLIKEKK
ncbi:MAG: DUF1003 domain-containing protein [Patescibacteria group bacterium]